MRLKKKQRIIMVFIIGYLMLAAGLLLFVNEAVAEMGVYAWTFLGLHVAKFVIIIPLMIGVLWLFQNYESWEAKIIITVGLLVIVLQAIRSIQYRFQPIRTSIYILIMVLLFGGMAIVIQSIHLKNKDRHLFSK